MMKNVDLCFFFSPRKFKDGVDQPKYWFLQVIPRPPSIALCCSLCIGKLRPLKGALSAVVQKASLEHVHTLQLGDMYVAGRCPGVAPDPWHCCRLLRVDFAAKGDRSIVRSIDTRNNTTKVKKYNAGYTRPRLHVLVAR